MLLLVAFPLSLALTSAIIILDRRRIERKMRDTDDVDFADRRLGPYLVTAVIFGPLPLILYFGSTRKGAMGFLIGAAWALAVMVVVALVVAVVATFFGWR